MSKVVTVFEFDEISADGNLDKRDFEDLKKFIVSEAIKAQDDDEGEYYEDASACFSLSARGGREIIKAKNHVGVVALSSGTIIEILPKIAKKETDCVKVRKLVLEMLKVTGDIPYKSFQKADLLAEKMSLYDVYIKLFLEELSDLYKKGLKAGYVYKEENENRFKGKLIINKQVLHNAAHGERFYVGYEEFDFNRAENRIIKSTLDCLKRKCRTEQNGRLLRRMTLLLDEIQPSENIESDLNKCATDRTAKDYETVLSLARVFLRNKSFTTNSGRTNATALLFPMDRLFEAFMATGLEKAASDAGYSLSSQDRGMYLFGSVNARNGKFPLRPDIVLTKDNDVVIIDTKWKRLYDNPQINYGISQADMYQMYAYHTRYVGVKRVILLYPKYEEIFHGGPIEYRTQAGDIDVIIEICTVDLNEYLDGKPLENCVYPAYNG